MILRFFMTGFRCCFLVYSRGTARVRDAGWVWKSLMRELFLRNDEI